MYKEETKKLWLFQFFGWLGYSIMIFTTIALSRGGMWIESILHLLLETLVGFLLTLIMQWRYRIAIRFDWKAIIFSTVIWSVLLSIIWTLYKWVSYLYLFEGKLALPTLEGFGHWLPASIGALVAWSGLYISGLYYLKTWVERKKTLEALAQAKEANLRMLRYQLNPHFLLNSLNALSTLILTQKTNQAVLMLENISRFLSCTLEDNFQSFNTLEEELNIVKLYLSIEETRFSDRFKFSLSISPDVDPELISVPSLITQPIVENAFKHSISRIECGGSIHINVYRQEDTLHIDIINDSAMNQSESVNNKPPKIGLSNTLNRLKSLYDEAATFSMEYHTSYTKASLVIPINRTPITQVIR